MKITSEQRKALEAKGYKIGKSGSTIQNAKGATIGGYNANGQVFSGSADVKSILKAKPAAPKAAAPASRPRASTKSASAKPSVKGGRGDGNYERVVRAADAAITRAQAASSRPPTAMTEAPKQSKPSPSSPTPRIVKPGTPAKPSAKPAPTAPSAKPTRPGVMDNPVSRAASNLGKRVGEFFGGKPKRKPVKLDPKLNKHPYD